MEKDLCRTISRGISLAYARERMRKAQQLLERFQLCDCSELGRCNHCVSRMEKSRGAFNDNLREKSTQTEESYGPSAVGYISCFDRDDAATGCVASPAVNEDNFTQARQRLPSADDVYDGIKNPYVLVINNVNFYKEPRPRNGAHFDRDNVRSFVREAGFKTVMECFDLSKEVMLDVMEKTRKKQSLDQHDSFICIIMSHGNEEGVLGTDFGVIPVGDITAKFQGGKCPQMATKPKLFFIQACRGVTDDKGYLVPRGPEQLFPDSGDEMYVKLPSDADFLIAYSTTKGYTSHRRYTDNARTAATQGRYLGSWFISCLVQVFHKYSHEEDLMTMLTRVNNSMTKKCSDRDKCKQMSCQLSMLTKKVYFANYFVQE